MPISYLFGATLSLILSQATIHTDNCQASWLDRKTFETIAAAELGETTSYPPSQSATVQISCTGDNATVVVSENIRPAKRPLLRRHISLSDTPDAMRTRTLALAASDAVRDFMNGTAAPPSTTPTISARAPSDTLSDLLHQFRKTRRISATASGFSSFPHFHIAPLLAVDLSLRRWHFGILGAGTRFRIDAGKVYTGMAALHLGYSIWAFTTRAHHIGEVNLGAWTGVVHARGLALAPGTGENHTSPMGALHVSFTYGIHPMRRVSLGFQLLGGWMLGMRLRAAGDIIGGFNNFFATAGIAVQFRENR